MVKLKRFFRSTFNLIWILVAGFLLIIFIANYFFRSTTPEGISEGIVFKFVKDTFFQRPPFFNQSENDIDFLNSQKILPGLSAIFRVEKANISEICINGKGLRPVDHWKIPNGFYFCAYGPGLSEIPYPEATGYMMTVLKGYRTTGNFWIIDEDFTKGIPKTVKAFRENNPSIIAEAKIVYQRKAQ